MFVSLQFPRVSPLVLCSSLIALAGCNLPQGDEADVAPVDVAGNTGLTPRSVLPSMPLPERTVEGQQYRLIVKFKDALHARVTPTQGLAFVTPHADPAAAQSIAQSRGLRFKQYLDLPAQTLRTVQERAEAASGVAQPDLAGIMTLDSDTVDAKSLLSVARELEKLNTVEYVYLQPLNVPLPADIAPTSAAFMGQQVYPGALGLDVSYAHLLNAKGQGIKISDVEYAWRGAHEDLNHINLNLEAGQTIPGTMSEANYDHGTAVMGIIVGGDNAYGVTGLSPLSTIGTYPIQTLTRVTPNTDAALASAIAQSVAGDVILIELQTWFTADGQYIPMEFYQATYDLIRSATQAGIIVVEAAGNGNVNLDTATYAAWAARGDSGAIMVGAGTTARARQTFSTYGSRVNVQAWGSGVTTLGYGDLAFYASDVNQKYTALFGGTSSASAMVAGFVGSAQSYAVSKLGRRLTPAEMRTLLVATGRGQTSFASDNIGPLPNMRNFINLVSRWPTAYSNQVGDPGFELNPSAAVAAPWGGVGDFRWIEQNIGKQRSGLDAAILYSDANAAPGWRAYTQTVNLLANTDYRVTAWVRGTSGVNGRLTMKHPTTGAFLTSMPFVPASTTAYQQVAETYFSSGTLTSSPLELGFNYVTAQGTQWINLDDFEVSPVSPMIKLNNAIVDPSFDSQQTNLPNPPWDLGGGTGTVEQGNGMSRRGNNAVSLSSVTAGQFKTIKQRVAVRPNTFYSFTGYTRGTTTINQGVSVLAASGWLGYQTLTPVVSPDRYEPFTLEFNSGPNTWVDVAVYYSAPGGSVTLYVDDLALVPTALTAPLNLVRDPGFEAHTGTALQYPYWAIGTAAVTTNSGPKSGVKNATLSSTDTGVVKTLAQDLPVEFSVPYRLKVSALANVPLTGKIGVKTRAGGAVGEKTINLTTAYQDFTLDFTSTTFTAEYVYFTYTSPGGPVTVKLDDWEVIRR